MILTLSHPPHHPHPFMRALCPLCSLSAALSRLKGCQCGFFSLLILFQRGPGDPALAPARLGSALSALQPQLSTDAELMEAEEAVGEEEGGRCVCVCCVFIPLEDVQLYEMICPPPVSRTSRRDTKQQRKQKRHKKHAQKKKNETRLEGRQTTRQIVVFLPALLLSSSFF